MEATLEKKRPLVERFFIWQGKFLTMCLAFSIWNAFYPDNAVWIFRGVAGAYSHLDPEKKQLDQAKDLELARLRNERLLHHSTLPNPLNPAKEK